MIRNYILDIVCVIVTAICVTGITTLAIILEKTSEALPYCGICAFCFGACCGMLFIKILNSKKETLSFENSPFNQPKD